MSDKNHKEDKKDYGLCDLSLGEIIDKLTGLQTHGYNNCKVRIVNSRGEKSCIGNILPVGDTENGIICLLPAPENINNVNSINRMLAMMMCDKAMSGQDCGKCSELTTCKHMKSIDLMWDGSNLSNAEST